MNKSLLKNFIDKFHLGGLCDQVKLISKDGKLATNFQSIEKDLIGFISANDINLETGQFGIFNTSLFLKSLSIFSDEMNIELEEEYGKFTKMKMSDKDYKASLLLADLDIIQDTKKLADLPPPSAVIKIDSSFIDKFIKSKNVLAETEVMAFVQNDDNIEVIINYADFNTNYVKYSIPAEINNNLSDPIKVNSNKVKEILIANKDCISGTIEIIKEGLVIFKFNSGNIATKYVLVMLA